jgi:SAM-dependent methyltransferase
MTASVVIWHDVECGAYADDLPLWRELAAATDGPVLDVGAGTGRVTLDLARLGFDVVALDTEVALLEALEERAAAADVTVGTVAADARAFDLGAQRFGLIIVPMQTVQLLGGAAGRGRFLATAAAHLAPGGLLAAALADALEAFDAEHDQPPPPDRTEVDGVVYASAPVAVRDRGDRAAIERVRAIIAPGGAQTASTDVIELDRLDVAELESEATAHGLHAEPPVRIPESDEYVGSTVAMLRA